MEDIRSRRRRSRFAFASSSRSADEGDESELLSLSSWTSEDEVWVQEAAERQITAFEIVPRQPVFDADAAERLRALMAAFSDEHGTRWPEGDQGSLPLIPYRSTYSTQSAASSSVCDSADQSPQMNGAQALAAAPAAATPQQTRSRNGPAQEDATFVSLFAPLEGRTGAGAETACDVVDGVDGSTARDGDGAQLREPGAAHGAADLAVVDGDMHACMHASDRARSSAVSPALQSPAAARDPDFIAQAADVRKVFSMAVSSSSVSVRVHRVGNTLVLDGELELPTRDTQNGAASPLASRPSRRTRKKRSSQAKAQRAEAQPRRAQSESLLCFGYAASDDGDGFGAGMLDAEDAGLHALHESLSRRRRFHDERVLPSASCGDKDPLPASDQTSTSAHLSSSAPPQRYVGTDASGVLGAREKSDGETSSLTRRVFSWELENVTLMLASDMLMYHSPPDQADTGWGRAVNLHHVEEQVSADLCLDLWLDNVVNRADALALCFHTEGALQGYHVIKTADIPSFAGMTEAAQACLHTGADLLRLLKERCTVDGASYLLHKDASSCTVRLFEVTQSRTRSPSPELHDTDPSPGPHELPASPVTHVRTSAFSASASDSDSDLTSLPPEAPLDPAAPATHACLREGLQSAPSLDNSSSGSSSSYRTRIATLCYRMASRLLVRGAAPPEDLAAIAGQHRVAQAERLLLRCCALTSARTAASLRVAALLRLGTIDVDRAAASGAPCDLDSLHVSSGSAGPSAAVVAVSHLPQRTAHSQSASPSGLNLHSRRVVQKAAAALQRAEERLSEGVSGLGGVACVAERHTTLMKRLRQSLLDALLQHGVLLLWDRQPGASLRCMVLAGCHLDALGRGRNARVALCALFEQAASAYAQLALLYHAQSGSPSDDVAAQEVAALKGGPPAPRAWLSEGDTLPPSTQLPNPQSLSLDVEINLNHAIGHFLSALKLCDAAEEGSAPQAPTYERLVGKLSAVYLRLGGALFRDGRFTRALQHFKQGVHLFEGLSAAAGVSACFCSMGALFCRRVLALDATSPDSLPERDHNGHASVTHFNMALQALKGCKLALAPALRGHIDRELAAAYQQRAAACIASLPFAPDKTDFAHKAIDMLRQALTIHERHAALPEAHSSCKAVGESSHELLELLAGWQVADVAKGLEDVMADVHFAQLQARTLMLQFAEGPSELRALSTLVSQGTAHAAKAKALLPQDLHQLRRAQIACNAAAMYTCAAQRCMPSHTSQQRGYFACALREMSEATEMVGLAPGGEHYDAAGRAVLDQLRRSLRTWLQSADWDQDAKAVEVLKGAYRASLMDAQQDLLSLLRGVCDIVSTLTEPL